MEAIYNIRKYEDIDIEIKKRESVLMQMVGNLYPRIILKEIAELQRMKKEYPREYIKKEEMEI